MYKYRCSVCDLESNFEIELKGNKCPRCTSKDTFCLVDRKPPYLQITLDRLHSVPKVIYKGKEINLKQEVLFYWETDTFEQGGTTIEIEYLEDDKKYPKSTKVIERIKGHATH